MLIYPLKKEEVARHKSIIGEWLEEMAYDPSKVEIGYVGNGAAKGVYSVRLKEGLFVAAAANRDEEEKLLQEYATLNHLWENSPGYFPQPHSHHTARNGQGELIVMELLPHVDIDRVPVNTLEQGFRQQAYEIGRAGAISNVQTGHYSSEPHSGNILGQILGGKLDLRFCDAAQFKEGTLDDSVRAILTNSDERPYCFRFAPHFYKGLCAGLEEVGDQKIDREQIKKTINEFNQIVN